MSRNSTLACTTRSESQKLVKLKHSCVLFVDPLGDPLEFYMRPCSSRDTVQQLIEHGGGVFYTTGGTNIIRLVESGTKVLNPNAKELVLSEKYVYDCVDKNILLDTQPYVVKVDSVNTSDISEDEDVKYTPNIAAGLTNTLYRGCEDLKLVDYVFQHEAEFCRMSTVNFCFKMSQEKVVNRSAKSINNRFYIILSNHSSYIPLQKLEAFRKLWNCKASSLYTPEEDLAILKYICKTNAFHRIRGMTLYREMAEAQVTSHSARSMGSRLLRILNQLDNYDISEKEKALLLRKGPRNDTLPIKNMFLRNRGKDTNPYRNESVMDDVPSKTHNQKRISWRSKRTGNNQNAAETFDFKLKVGKKNRSEHKSKKSNNNLLTAVKIEPPDTPKVRSNNTGELHKRNHKSKKTSSSPHFVKISSVYTLNQNTSKPSDHKLTEEPQNASNTESPVSNTNSPPSPEIPFPGKSQTASTGKADNSRVDSSANICVTPTGSNVSPFSRSHVSPTLVTEDHRGKTTRVRLYDPELYQLSLPDTVDNITLRDEVDAITQHIAATNVVQALPSMDMSCDVSNKSIAEMDTESPALECHEMTSCDSTPDCLDSYDISLLNKLDKALDTTLDETSLKNTAASEDPISIHPSCQQVCEVVAPDSTSTAFSKSVRDEDDLCGDGELVAGDTSVDEGMEINDPFPNERKRKNDLEESRPSSPVGTSQNMVADIDAMPSSTPTDFINEATTVVYKMEQLISSLNETIQADHLQSDLEKLKLRLYNQLLTTQVERVLKKPKLSVPDKALLTKYVAHFTGTTPEDVLRREIGFSGSIPV